MIYGMATSTFQLIDISLKGRTLRSLVSAARRSGQSWQAIADEIRDLTGVIVSRETIRGWFPELTDAALAAKAAKSA